MDSFTQKNLLFDFYGELLSKRQRQVASLYYEENLSLSEIGETFQISRQGVHDALKNAEKTLESYEGKLGLLARLEKRQHELDRMEKILEKVMEQPHQEWEEKELKEIYRILLSIKE